jgi:hypothetical protein
MRHSVSVIQCFSVSVVQSYRITETPSGAAATETPRRTAATESPSGAAATETPRRKAATETLCRIAATETPKHRGFAATDPPRLRRIPPIKYE